MPNRPNRPDRPESHRLDLIRSVLRDTSIAVAEESYTFPLGWGVRSREFPLIWTLNQLCITEPGDLEGIVALAESHQGDLKFRHFHVEDDATAEQIEQPLKEAGWRVDREVLMALDSPPDRVADMSAVVELSEDQMIGLMRRWGLEERPQATDDEFDQVTEYNRREGRLWNEKLIGALDEEGKPVAITKFRSNGVIGWVEDVYTAPEARGRGHARMLVTYATEVMRPAGHELIFIIADDHDWPKDLYAKIGFRAVGFIHTFHLEVSQDTVTE